MTRYWISGLTLLGIGITLSLLIGAYTPDLQDLLLLQDDVQILIVTRFPRTAALILTGSGMAIAGALLQMIALNRFIDPVTTGAGQSAALGLLVTLYLVPDASLIIKMCCAILCAILGTFGLIALLRRLPPYQPLWIPLVSIAYGSVLGAIVSFWAFQADLLQYLSIWFIGDFSGMMQGQYELLWFTLLAGILTYACADQFTILSLGKAASLNLGLNYHIMNRLGLILISSLTAMTLIIVGMIPFVGLIVPNMVSRLLGDHLRKTLPFTALSGALLVLYADILGRVLRYPYEIPASTIIGVLGALIFLWLLYRPSALTSPYQKAVKS